MTVTNKLATQVLQKAFENSSQVEGKTATTGQGNFADLFKNAQSDLDFPKALGIGDNRLLSNSPAQAISAEQIAVDPDAVTLQFDKGKNPVLVDLLSDFNSQSQRMDTLMNDVIFGNRRYSNQELLVMQAQIFHMAQEVELTVKVAELGVSSFKGVMNTQIQ